MFVKNDNTFKPILAGENQFTPIKTNLYHMWIVCQFKIILKRAWLINRVWLSSPWKASFCRLDLSLFALNFKRSKTQLWVCWLQLSSDIQEKSVRILWTNNKSVFRSLDQYWPIRGQCSGHVICYDQSEVSIRVTWSAISQSEASIT